MSGHQRIVIGGELHLSLEAVADCYGVEAAWVREVYGLGLLGRGQRHDETVVVAARMLDRVAEIVRLHDHYRIDLKAIILLLGREDD